jgi:hypothetical protein
MLRCRCFGEAVQLKSGIQISNSPHPAGSGSHRSFSRFRSHHHFTFMSIQVSRMSVHASTILLIALISSVSASILQWHQVAPEPSSDRPLPETRYSHCAVVIDGKMYVTHGYYFDMTRNEASWLHNTWEFNFGTKAWSQIDTERCMLPIFYNPFFATLVLTLTFADSVPLARYGATCNEFEGNLYFHGGDDGGNSKGLRSYVHTFFSGAPAL